MENKAKRKLCNGFFPTHFMRGSRVTQKAFERLELCAVKVARTVLRRAAAGNSHRLSDRKVKDFYRTLAIC